MHFTRLDLTAMDIMRGRDNGLPDYNTARRNFGLPERQWHEINPKLYKERPEVNCHMIN
jgi:dual oxidase